MTNDIVPQTTNESKTRVLGRFDARETGGKVFVVREALTPHEYEYRLVYPQADTESKCTCGVPHCRHEETVALTSILQVSYLRPQPGMGGVCRCGAPLLCLASASGHLLVAVCAEGCGYGLTQVHPGGSNGRPGHRARTAVRHVGR